MENPVAHQASKGINAWIVELVGTKKLKILVMVNTRKKFPREYSDQVISLKSFDGNNLERAPGPGLKQQAIEESVPYTDVIEAQASSFKHQAQQVPSGKLQAQTNKRQASSLK